MTPEQIQALIDQLLRTGEILATEGFRLTVRQMYVSALTNSMWAIFMFILSINFMKKSHESEMLAKNADYDQEDKYIFNSVLFWVISAISAILSFSLITLAVSYMLNPEWYAVKLLLATMGIGQ